MFYSDRWQDNYDNMLPEDVYLNFLDKELDEEENPATYCEYDDE